MVPSGSHRPLRGFKMKVVPEGVPCGTKDEASPRYFFSRSLVQTSTAWILALDGNDWCDHTFLASLGRRHCYSNTYFPVAERIDRGMFAEDIHFEREASICFGSLVQVHEICIPLRRILFTRERNLEAGAGSTMTIVRFNSGANVPHYTHFYDEMD